MRDLLGQALGGVLDLGDVLLPVEVQVRQVPGDAVIVADGLGGLGPADQLADVTGDLAGLGQQREVVAEPPPHRPAELAYPIRTTGTSMPGKSDYHG
jgi:hypothetical protein